MKGGFSWLRMPKPEQPKPIAAVNPDHLYMDACIAAIDALVAECDEQMQQFQTEGNQTNYNLIYARRDGLFAALAVLRYGPVPPVAPLPRS